MCGERLFGQRATRKIKSLSGGRVNLSGDVVVAYISTAPDSELPYILSIQSHNRTIMIPSARNLCVKLGGDLLSLSRSEKTTF
jgi:hypothetical protein